MMWASTQDASSGKSKLRDGLAVHEHPQVLTVLCAS